MPVNEDPEWLTRKQRIDPELERLGWPKMRAGQTTALPHRIEEFETANGPADYALCIDGKPLGIDGLKRG